MHELSIAVEIVERAVARANGARIRRITLQVGVLSCVLPDALSFSFEIAAQGTSAHGARLEIRSPKAAVRCRRCHASFELDRGYGSCVCGSVDLDWQSGRELTLLEMEIEDGANPVPELEAN